MLLHFPHVTAYDDLLHLINRKILHATPMCTRFPPITGGTIHVFPHHCMHRAIRPGANRICRTENAENRDIERRCNMLWPGVIADHEASLSYHTKQLLQACAPCQLMAFPAEYWTTVSARSNSAAPAIITEGSGSLAANWPNRSAGQRLASLPADGTRTAN